MAIEKEPNNIPNSQNTLEGTEDMQVAIEAIEEAGQEDFETHYGQQAHSPRNATRVKNAGCNTFGISVLLADVQTSPDIWRVWVNRLCRSRSAVCGLKNTPITRTICFVTGALSCVCVSVTPR